MVSVIRMVPVMPGLDATCSLMAGLEMCTVGTAWMSESSDIGERLTRTMPTAPASPTTCDFSTRALTPRSQTTILPSALAGSMVSGRHSSGLVAPVLPASAARTSSVSSTSREATETPRYLVPSSISTVPVSSAENVDAATVVSHGEA